MKVSNSLKTLKNRDKDCNGIKFHAGTLKMVKKSKINTIMYRITLDFKALNEIFPCPFKINYL